MHRHAWYNIAMKRIITLLIIAIAIASPLAASSQYATVSVAGGYTSTTRSAIIGAGANYGYLSDVSRFVGIGFGSHLDFAFVNSHYGGFSFGALVVVGNRNGRVGYGYGKANEVSDAIRKAQEAAKKHLVTIPRFGTTIPHTVTAKYSGSKILLRPASAGTGIIAGGAMRAVLDLAGIVDVLGKSLGSGNPANVIKATFKAIDQMRSKEDVMLKRGLVKAE